MKLITDAFQPVDRWDSFCSLVFLELEINGAPTPYASGSVPVTGLASSSNQSDEYYAQAKKYFDQLVEKGTKIVGEKSIVERNMAEQIADLLVGGPDRVIEETSSGVRLSKKRRHEVPTSIVNGPTTGATIALEGAEGKDDEATKIRPQPFKESC